MAVDLNKSQHSSLHNYQQASLNTTTTTLNGTRTITHSLGYIPYARLWVEHLSGEVSPIIIASAQTVYHSAYEPIAVSNITGTELTSSDLIVSAATADTKTVYYRVYIDRAS